MYDRNVVIGLTFYVSILFRTPPNYLGERTINPETGKSHYTHRQLRSAYFSLKRNLAYLFVFERYPDLDIPNTTNLLDGAFAGLKRHAAFGLSLWYEKGE